MSNWWNALDSFEKFFWGLAIPFTVLFIIQMTLMVVGIDNDGEIDFDSHGDTQFEVDFGEDIKIPLNFRIFSLRNIIVFFTIFSWGGIVGNNNNFGVLKTLLFAITLALSVVVFLTFILKMLLKATQSGTMDIKNSIDSYGVVYLKIPQKGKGEGKVQLIVQGSLRELDAISEENEIMTGAKVKVIGVTTDNKLIVEEVVKNKLIK